jgi:hypothetical protein
MGMPQNLLTPHKKKHLSIASMVAFNDSLDHLPFRFVTNALFVLANLCIVFDIIGGRTFSLFASYQSNAPLRPQWRMLNIMMFLVFLDPTSKSLMECG